MAGKITKEDLQKAFHCAKNNREEVLSGEVCGCFACANTFHTHEIDHWIRSDTGETALCPHCYLDAVIGEKSGFPITREFLLAMNDHWFDGILEMDWRSLSRLY